MQCGGEIILEKSRYEGENNNSLCAVNTIIVTFSAPPPPPHHTHNRSLAMSTSDRNRQLQTWDSWEDPDLHFDSLFFASWVSFLFLWHTWNIIELKYGMQTEFSRRISSLDLIICHLGGSAFFLPLRYLAKAPAGTKNSVMITAFVVYVISFYFGMALLKLSQSIPLQICTMVLCFAYLFLYYFAGKLSELLTADGGIPHSWWMLFNLMVMAAVVLKERYRVNHFDPLDYNYTAAQRKVLRANKYSGRGQSNGTKSSGSSSSGRSGSSMTQNSIRGASPSQVTLGGGGGGGGGGGVGVARGSSGSNRSNTAGRGGAKSVGGGGNNSSNPNSTNKTKRGKYAY